MPGLPGCQTMGPWIVPYKGILGSIIGGEPGADMIQASGQASWADLVWVETLKHMEGQHITSSSSVDLDME